MAKEFIIAIELGSSKMTGIAGKKNVDGSINVLAVAKEDSTSCIRKGVVYNIDKTTTCITNLVNKLRNNLQTEIAQVYVGVGGQSLRSTKNTIVRDLAADTIVSQDMVDSIMDGNRAMTYPEHVILEASVQEYKVDQQYQSDPVGIECHRLEGNILNILWKRQFYRNLKKCLDNAGIHVAEMYLAPLALADNVLTDTERRTGCLLVDLGADTTTVAVYSRNILRHLAVIPLGAANITKDVASLQIDDSEAEKLKVAHGHAIAELKNDNTDDPELRIGGDRSVTQSKLDEIVSARAEEIIENVWYQVPAEYRDKLLAGIVITGGGSNLAATEKAFKQYTGIDKVRTAGFVNLSVQAISPTVAEQVKHDGTMNTVISLLAKGNENCAGNIVNNTLFPNESEDDTATPRTTSGNRTTAGIVDKDEEKQKAEAEAARKKAEAEQQAEAERLAKEKEEEEERRRKAPAHKLMGWFKNLGKAIVTGDGEE